MSTEASLPLGQIAFTVVLVVIALLMPRGATAGPNRFEQWAAGRIKSVDAGHAVIELRDAEGEAAKSFQWNKDSRLWRAGGSKEGQPVEAGALKVSEDVKIQFRKTRDGEPGLILKIIEVGVPK